MNLLLFPGNNPDNEAWINRVSDSLSDIFDSRSVVFYRYWHTGEKMISFDNELKTAAFIADKTGKYSAFAKSVGTLLVLRAIHEGVLNPDFCIFCGTAVNFANRSGFPLEDWLNSVKCPVLMIQKKNDPAYSSSSLKELVKGKESTFTVEEIEGDNHEYDDLALLTELIQRFVEKVSKKGRKNWLWNLLSK